MACRLFPLQHTRRCTSRHHRRALTRGFYSKLSSSCRISPKPVPSHRRVLSPITAPFSCSPSAPLRLIDGRGEGGARVPHYPSPYSFDFLLHAPSWTCAPEIFVSLIPIMSIGATDPTANAFGKSDCFQAWQWERKRRIRSPSCSTESLSPTSAANHDDWQL